MSTSTKPDHYVLQGEYDDTQLTYDTTSITGEPLLSYKDGKYDVSKRGDEIRTQDLGLGTLVTVTLEAVPDANAVHLSVLIPEINLSDGPTEFETVAILTTTRSGFAGPGLLTGALQSYETKALRGTASQVES
jgi:hypothetical protein